MPSKVDCGKNIALSFKEGILSGEESRDDSGVLFGCGGSGGGGGGYGGVSVSMFIVAASVCDIEMGCGLSVVVCTDVGVWD